MATNFPELLRVLVDGHAEFVVIGGVAVIAQGYPRLTLDLDVCYARTPENLAHIVSALTPLKPRLRGAPAELPFIFDERTLKNGLNFTFVTTLGQIDLLGEVTGIGGYVDIAPTAVRMDVHGQTVAVLDLDLLERSKAAAGRAKDLIDLEAIRVLKKKRT
jgi:hypothetical protein